MNRFQKFARKLFFGLGNQYESGQQYSRRRSRIPGVNPSDQKTELPAGTRQEMVKRSRHIAQNSGFAQEAATLFQTYAIGEGIRPQATTDNEEWNRQAEEIFSDWTRRPEITGQFNFSEVQHLVSRALDFDGEIFAIKIRDRFGVPRIQLLETHRFSLETNPAQRIFHGIKYDSIGRPVAYLLKLPDRYGTFSESRTRAISARSVMHVFEPTSISASRGIPPGQHGLLHLQDELETVALMKQKIKDHAEKSLILKSNRDTALEEADIQFDSEDLAPLQTDERTVAETLGGRTLRINENETLESLSSQDPHANFRDFIDWNERDASGGILPFEVIRNASDVGGASVRLVVSKTDRRIRYRQQVISSRLIEPAWFYVIGDAIDQGELEAMPRWNRIRTTTTKRITVDAGREAQANREDVKTGLKLISEDIAERGGDFDEWLRMRTEQARKILTAAGHPEIEPIPLNMIYNPGDIIPRTGIESENAR